MTDPNLGLAYLKEGNTLPNGIVLNGNIAVIDEYLNSNNNLTKGERKHFVTVGQCQ